MALGFVVNPPMEGGPLVGPIDLVVSARNFSSTTDGVGRVYVIPESASDLADASVSTITGSLINEGLGEFLALGDLNQDGGGPRGRDRPPSASSTISATTPPRSLAARMPTVAEVSATSIRDVSTSCRTRRETSRWIPAALRMSRALKARRTETSSVFRWPPGNFIDAVVGDELAIGAPYADRESPPLTNSGVVYLWEPGQLQFGSACVASDLTRRIDGRKNWDQLGLRLGHDRLRSVGYGGRRCWSRRAGTTADSS